jgi:hypothetical protein
MRICPITVPTFLVQTSPHFKAALPTGTHCLWILSDVDGNPITGMNPADASERILCPNFGCLAGELSATFETTVEVCRHQADLVTSPWGPHISAANFFSSEIQWNIEIKKGR